jgi:hypothetical protein
MTTGRHHEIDSTLDAWASAHGFTVHTQEHWDDKHRSVLVVDSGGDSYVLYAGQNDDDAGEQVAIAGASLTKRGGSKHRAFHRERERFCFRSPATLASLSSALDEAYARIQRWAHEAGHTL